MGPPSAATQVNDSREELLRIAQRLRFGAEASPPDSSSPRDGEPAPVRDGANLPRDGAEADDDIRKLRAEMRQQKRRADAAQEEVRKLREELRSARRDVGRVQALTVQLEDRDRRIVTLTSQLAAIHARWADDVEQLHSQYLTRSLPPPVVLPQLGGWSSAMEPPPPRWGCPADPIPPFSVFPGGALAKYHPPPPPMPPPVWPAEVTSYWRRPNPASEVGREPFAGDA